MTLGNTVIRVCMMLTLAFIHTTPVSAVQRGEVSGGIAHSAPGWFKDSFLEISDDVSEAAELNKHVILFFQLNDCPYCHRMLVDCFESQPMKELVQDSFDVIAINIKGDREIAFNETLTMSEKQLSEELNVFATPSIIFVNKQNQQVTRVDGYRSPQRFKHVLNYVSTQAYKDTSLSAYIESHQKTGAYTFRDHSLFKQVTDFSSIDGPLAVIFEDTACNDCAEFHENLLSRDDVQTELARFTAVRLDAASDKPIIDIEGNTTTAKAWAHSLYMLYRPGVILFDKGKEISRIESLLYSYHFKETLRYVGAGYHKQMEYRQYSEQRREELLSSGVDIQLSD